MTDFRRTFKYCILHFCRLSKARRRRYQAAGGGGGVEGDGAGLGAEYPKKYRQNKKYQNLKNSFQSQRKKTVLYRRLNISTEW